MDITCAYTYVYVCIYVSIFWSKEDASKQEATEPPQPELLLFFFLNIYIKGNNLSMDLFYLVRNLLDVSHTPFYGHLLWRCFHDEYFRAKTRSHEITCESQVSYSILAFKIKV